MVARITCLRNHVCATQRFGPILFQTGTTINYISTETESRIFVLLTNKSHDCISSLALVDSLGLQPSASLVRAQRSSCQMQTAQYSYCCSSATLYSYSINNMQNYGNSSDFHKNIDLFGNLHSTSHEYLRTISYRDSISFISDNFLSNRNHYFPRGSNCL